MRNWPCQLHFDIPLGKEGSGDIGLRYRNPKRTAISYAYFKLVVIAFKLI